MAQPLHNAAEAAAWLADRVRTVGFGTLRTDSRQVRPGDAFIAWPGYATDGRQFVAAALAAGAAACLVETEGLDAALLPTDDARIASLSGLKAATGEIAARWFDRPSERLQVIAVTGTNGKSSTAWWTAQALSALGQRCGLVGTLGIGEPPRAAAGSEPPRAAAGGEPPQPEHPGRIQPTGLTTPDPVTLQAAFRRMADTGFAACAVEASSIGLAEHRLAGTAISVAQFTNLSRDHLDYHGDMAAYWAAKRALFNWPGLQAAVINIDDARGAGLAQALALAPAPAPVSVSVSADSRADAAIDLWTTSVAGPARLQAADLGYIDGGLAFTLVEGEARVLVRSALIGDYNASNLLAVLGAMRALGVPLAQAAAVVPGLTPVPGRMDRVPALPGAGPQPELVVDYAHTPDALDKALAALRPLAAARGGRLWCVFGCGGNRDASKRPLMGAIARRGADHLVLTSDNPRGEAPAAILAQILAGIEDAAHAGVHVIEDRRAAIGHAVLQADARDVVLLAGKGHEDTQEIGGVKRPFLDSAVAAEALARRGAR
jgi:UDP-N-acetylmuramoyl-L-alanyl-D-glutamate--2,6-diaminopimelate ligase